MSDEEHEQSFEEQPANLLAGASPEPTIDEFEDEDDKAFHWEDAMENLEKQKQVIQGNQQATNEGNHEEADETPGACLLNAEEGLQSPNLRFILDIPLQVTVELGRKRLIINDLLRLNQGSVIELTKQIGEPLEVLVNQKLIARGEVVVINDKFGVRITNIVSPSERIQQS